VPVDHDPFRDAAGSRPKRQTGKKADDDRENRDPRAFPSVVAVLRS
jgi:hypothetical protein